jgi:uncharacterized protein (TIGR00369 family)
MELNTNNIKERIDQSFIKKLGIEFIETEDINTLEATLYITKDLVQTTGVLHGGVTITLAETVAGIGSNVLCQADEYCLGIQISANHISSGKVGDTIKARGQLMHKGRSTHLWNVDVFSETSGKLISSVRATNAVLKRKK